MKSLTFFVSVLFVTSTYACPIDHQELLAQKQQQAAQKRLLPIDYLASEGSLDLGQFRWAVEAVKDVYGPIFTKKGLTLRINASWESEALNAHASQFGGNAYVDLNGGYARMPFMTRDAFLSVICHEVGHHLGGFPRYKSITWASSEGQADYFSTLKCMKNIFAKETDTQAVAEAADLPALVLSECRSQFPQDKDYFICLRSAKASEDYGRAAFFRRFKLAPTSISLLNPNPIVRLSSNERHPEPQCRADTKYQGALCNVDPKIPVSETDELGGVCHPRRGDTLGIRPGCWFAHFRTQR